MKTGEYVTYFLMGYFAYFRNINKPESVPYEPWADGQEAAKQSLLEDK